MGLIEAQIAKAGMVGGLLRNALSIMLFIRTLQS